MNKYERYLVELLQGHLDGVEVVKNFQQRRNLPCVTLDISGGVSTWGVYRYMAGGKEFQRYRRQALININTWCNTESEREELNAKILDCFYMEQIHHYTYCSNYNEGICSTSGLGDCSAVGTPREVCPAPYLYKYTSLRQKYDIISGTVNIEPPFDLDERGQRPPLLRSVLKSEAQFYDFIPIPTPPVTTAVDYEGVISTDVIYSDSNVLPFNITLSFEKNPLTISECIVALVEVTRGGERVTGGYVQFYKDGELTIDRYSKKNYFPVINGSAEIEIFPPDSTGDYLIKAVYTSPEQLLVETEKVATVGELPP